MSRSKVLEYHWPTVLQLATVLGLNKGERAYVEARAAGLSIQEAVAQLGKSRQTVQAHQLGIQRKIALYARDACRRYHVAIPEVQQMERGNAHHQSRE